jgi:photosystem II stability/assembly factor-like uncharacterized protein
MKFVLFTLVCFVITFNSLSQNLQKPSPLEIQSLPLWAQRMYGENPNVWEVDSLYRLYYKNEAFQKSYHTQYYKRWRRSVQNCVNSNGFVSLPTQEELNQHNKMYLKKQNAEKSSSWTVIGPILSHAEGGNQGSDQTNVYSIDQCLNQPNYMYLGTEPGEVYKSTDGGQSWSLSSKNEDFGSGVTSVEVNPDNGNIVFAGGNRGVFRSTDGGTTWAIVLSNTNFGVNEILIHPNNTSLVFAATDKGLYRSTDGGTSWTQLYSNKTYDIKIHPTSPDVMYILKNNPTAIICEFLKSTDFGSTWTITGTNWYNSTDPARNDGGGRLAVSSAQPNRVYAYLIGESKVDDFGYIGVFRSDDAGASWILPNGPVGGPYSTSHVNLAIGWATWTYHQGFYNCGLMASPTNADEILVGGLNLYKSTDAGATFQPVAGYVGGPLGMHVDMQDFRMVGNTAWITTDGGAYKSNDFFTTYYTFSMNGVHGSDYWGFGSGWNEDVLVGGLYHNGNLAYHENYPSGQFLQMGGGEAPTGYVNPGQNRKTYYSDVAGKILPLQLTDPIVNSAFGMAPNESYYAAESSELEFHPNCYGIAYLGKDNSIWKTTDGGASFNLLFTFGTNTVNQVKYIEVSSSNPNVIYLNQQPASGSAGTLWKTTDGGISWSQVNKPTGNSRRMLLAIDPTNENQLWVAYPDGANGSKVYKTTNSGQTWENWTSTALNNESIQSLVHIAGTDGGVYVATNQAVYYRNNTSSFTIDNAGLPLYTNGNILRPFYRDAKIRLASYGKGIWESNLNEAPTLPIARAMVDKLNQEVICEIDSFYFEDHSFLNHQGASWSWTFPTGSPSTSTERNPAVYFSQAGSHWAILQITDGNGNTDADSISVNVNFLTAATAIQEDFQQAFPPSGWSVQSNNGAQWSLSADCGGYGTSSQSSIFDNYNNDSGGAADDLIVTFDPIAITLDPYLNFDVAYALYGGIYSDTLQVLASTDCGATYTMLYEKGGTTLSTSPDLQDFFIPTSSQWRTDSVDLSSFAGADKLQIAFRNIGRYGNCVYLDNINIAGTTGIAENPFDEPLVYPNPVRSNQPVIIQYSGEFKVTCFDQKGARVQMEDGMDKVIFNTPKAAGTYLLQIHTPTKIWNKKLVIH